MAQDVRHKADILVARADVCCRRKADIGLTCLIRFREGQEPCCANDKTRGGGRLGTLKQKAVIFHGLLVSRMSDRSSGPFEAIRFGGVLFCITGRLA